MRTFLPCCLQRCIIFSAFFSFLSYKQLQAKTHGCPKVSVVIRSLWFTSIRKKSSIYLFPSPRQWNETWFHSVVASNLQHSWPWYSHLHRSLLVSHNSCIIIMFMFFWAFSENYEKETSVANFALLFFIGDDNIDYPDMDIQNNNNCCFD